MRDSKDDTRAESRILGRVSPAIAPSPGNLPYGPGWIRGLPGNGNRRQCGHKAAPEISTTSIGTGPARNWRQDDVSLSCDAVSYLK